MENVQTCQFAKHILFAWNNMQPWGLLQSSWERLCCMWNLLTYSERYSSENCTHALMPSTNGIFFLLRKIGFLRKCRIIKLHKINCIACYFQVIFSDVKENLKVYSCFLYSFRKMWNLFPDILKRSQKYAKIEILTKGKNMVFNIF